MLKVSRRNNRLTLLTRIRSDRSSGQTQLSKKPGPLAGVNVLRVEARKTDFKVKRFKSPG